MNVTLIDKMGSDATVVNAARVSFAKQIEGHRVGLTQKDEKLIKYLAEHEHWSPFAHASLQFRIKAPVFVARQLVKHQVGLVWNEVSRRYVDDEPEFYVPFMWRKRPPKSIKQGSSKEEVEYDITNEIGILKKLYNDMIEKGIAPEMARMVLPQNMMTEWYWSGSLYAFARVCNLRLKEDTQSETRDVVTHIEQVMRDQFPVSSQYLLDN
jgi:thymidylate synthase (FAD)